MEVLAEAQTLAEKSGIGADVVQNLVKGTFQLSPVLRVAYLYGRCIDLLPAAPYVLEHCHSEVPNSRSLSCSLIAYGDKMLNDSFDGSKGFAINGGIKDAS
jgi:hypothetical protein